MTDDNGVDAINSKTTLVQIVDDSGFVLSRYPSMDIGMATGQNSHEARRPKRGPYVAVRKLGSGSAGLVEYRNKCMTLDEPFPLSLFSARVRAAIVSEFNGRCPSQQDVAGVPDAHWLAMPAIGPVILKKIRASVPAEAVALQPMTDTELLGRIRRLQREIEVIHRTVRDRTLAELNQTDGLPSEASLA